MQEPAITASRNERAQELDNQIAMVRENLEYLAARLKNLQSEENRLYTRLQKIQSSRTETARTLEAADALLERLRAEQEAI